MFTEELTTDAPAMPAWYAADFERRVTELTEVLRIEITEQLRAQFNAELEDRVAAAQTERRAAADSTAVTQELIEEIAAAQDDLQKKEAELASKMTADVFPFADVLKLQAEKTELAAYLRGLNFRAAAARR